MKLTEKRQQFYIGKLCKFCHKPGCENWESCPGECYNNCEENLDVYTAMAWDIADELSSLYYPDDIEWEGESDLETMELMFGFVGGIIWIGHRNSVANDKKYLKLQQILCPLCDDLRTSIGDLKAKLKKANNE